MSVYKEAHLGTVPSLRIRTVRLKGLQ